MALANDLMDDAGSTQPMPQDADDLLQDAVLAHLLGLHPIVLIVEELIREMGAGYQTFDRRDAVLRAIRDLVATGLLHRHGDFVFPTRAAHRFNELLR